MREAMSVTVWCVEEDMANAKDVMTVAVLAFENRSGTKDRRMD